MNTQQTITKLAVAPAYSPVKPITNISVIETDPEKVLAFATKAAKALKKIIDAKSKKIIINGEQFLSFEDWLTVARFYNTSVGIEWTKTITEKDGFFGYEAKATAFKDGNIVSSAEASCTREEKNWKDKPTFQLRSMSQTRAMAKCLRNVFAWVVVLSNFSPTPAEEMDYDIKPAPEEHQVEEGFADDKFQENSYCANENFRNWENRGGATISEKQEKLLRSLILEKFVDPDEQQSQLNGISQMTKYDASQAISSLLENKY